MKKLILIIVFFISACAPPTQAVVPTAITNAVYVSPLGSDTNSGSITSPFKTIPKGISAAGAGYTVFVRAGTYAAFSVSKSDLIISGYMNERPVIRGGTGVRLSGSNITLAGFEVTAMTGNWSAAILSTGANNTIQANSVHDNIYPTISGIMILRTTNNQVLNNEVYNNNFVGIRIYGSDAAQNLVADNRAYNHTLSTGDSDGIDCDGAASQNTFRGNITYGNSDDGLDVWSCTNNTVTSNLSHNNGGTGDGNGIKLGLGGGNTVISNTSHSNYTCGFTSNGAGNYYENNTSYSNGTCGFDDGWRVSGNTQNSSFINNLAYGNPRNFIKGVYTTVFTGNSEVPVTGTPYTQTATVTSVTPTLTPSPTITVTPSRTPTATITATTIAPLPGTPVCDPVYAARGICIYVIP